MLKDQSNYNFTIHKEVGIVSEKPSGWTMELNLVSFNGREAMYDLSEWNYDYTALRRGVRLSESDLASLAQLIKKHLEETRNAE